MDQADMNENDLLGQATRALRETPVPQDLTDEELDGLVTSIAAALTEPSPSCESIIRTHPAQSTARLVPDVPTEWADGVSRETRPKEQFPGRRRVRRRFAIMFERRVVRWSVVAAAAAVVLAIGLWPSGSGRGRSNGVAWADVVETISRFRPYSCTYTWEHEGQPPRVYELMRLTLSRRREVFPNGEVRIFDLSQTPNVTLSLSPGTKRAERCVLLGTGVQQDPDFLQILGTMRDGTAENLGTEEVEGRLARGFHLPAEVNEFTVWADAETGLPIRIELNQPRASRRLILSEFQFDVTFDASLFDTTAAEGYTVHEVSVDGVNPTEQDLVEGLRAICTCLGGHFPPALDEASIEDAVREHHERTQETPVEAEMESLRLKTQRVLRYIVILKGLRGAQNLTYAGRGVTLGDGATPVLWWTPKGSQTTRILYGDLSARDVAVDQTPAAPAE